MTLDAGGRTHRRESLLRHSIGLLDYGLHLAGVRHAWMCEADEWRRGILHRRWPGIPVHDDVRAVDADTCERVDLIAGGFPCKGASTAGKRTGFDHPETVLWREMARAVGELRPRYVLLENVANLLVLRNGSLWGEVLGTLAALGYDTVWDCLPAAAVGATHRRDRVFAVAVADAAHIGPERGGRARGGGTRPADGGEPASDAVLAGLEGGGLRRPAADRASAAPDTARDAEGGPGTQAGTDGQRARAGDHASADTDRDVPRADHGAVGAGEDGQAGAEPSATRGVAVDWAEYAPAIRRWEAIHGPAPEPLVRRVDDRGAARVERSRLSALGDGVQVQVGRIAGEYVMGLERERLRTAA